MAWSSNCIGDCPCWIIVEADFWGVRLSMSHGTVFILGFQTVTWTEQVFDIGQKASFQFCWFPSPFPILWPCKGNSDVLGSNLRWILAGHPATTCQKARRSSSRSSQTSLLCACTSLNSQLEGWQTTAFACSTWTAGLQVVTGSAQFISTPRYGHIWTTNHFLDVVSKFQSSNLCMSVHLLISHPIFDNDQNSLAHFWDGWNNNQPSLAPWHHVSLVIHCCQSFSLRMFPLLSFFPCLSPPWGKGSAAAATALGTSSFFLPLALALFAEYLNWERQETPVVVGHSWHEIPCGYTGGRWNDYQLLVWHMCRIFFRAVAQASSQSGWPLFLLLPSGTWTKLWHMANSKMIIYEWWWFFSN